MNRKTNRRYETNKDISRNRGHSVFMSEQTSMCPAMSWNRQKDKLRTTFISIRCIVRKKILENSGTRLWYL